MTCYLKIISKYEAATVHVLYRSTDIWNKVYDRNYLTMNGFLVEAERLIKECGTIHNDFKDEMKDAEEGKVELIPKLQAMTECYRNRNYSIIKRLQRQMALITALDEAEQMWFKPLSEIESATNNIRKNAQDERWASYAERREPSFLTDKNRILSNISEVMNRSRIYRTMLVKMAW